MSHGMWLKQGDTAPNILLDTNADLTGVTSLRCRIWELSTHVPVIDRVATVIDGPTGTVDAGDGSTLLGGHGYQGELLVTFAGGEIQRFPQRGHFEMMVEEAIGVPAP